GFSDSTWSNAPAPFSYGEPGITTGTFLNDMRSNYSCIFLRQTFTVTDIGGIDALRLGAACDDGFIAWINGTEVARYNMPGGDIPYTGIASSAPPEPVPFTNYTLLNPSAYLVNGANVLAIQAFNNSLNDSSDLVMEASLSSEVSETVPPTITSVLPAAGTVNGLTSITVQFSEPVIGVDASDFLINGLAVGVVSGGGSTYTFTF